jgi:hypothetical protein
MKGTLLVAYLSLRTGVMVAKYGACCVAECRMLKVDRDEDWWSGNLYNPLGCR